MKEQLEKGLASCIQGEKNLNDLLSNQKEVVAKEGIGFTPKPKNKKKNDKAKRPPPLEQTFMKEGEGAPKEKKNNVKGGGVKKGNATPSNKAGDFNPPYDYFEWSIWVPKTLVTNIKGPITKWVPKTKH